MKANGLTVAQPIFLREKFQLEATGFKATVCASSPAENFLATKLPVLQALHKATAFGLAGTVLCSTYYSAKIAKAAENYNISVLGLPVLAKQPKFNFAEADFKSPCTKDLKSRINIQNNVGLS